MAPLSVVYGQRRISHVVADVAAHGTANSWLDIMVGVCIAGESGKNAEGIEAIYLYNDNEANSVVYNPYDTDNQEPAGRTDNVPPFYYKDPDYHYSYSIGLGKDTQLLDARMNAAQPARWGPGSGLANQQGKGIVTCYHGFFYDRDEEHG